MQKLLLVIFLSCILCSCYSYRAGYKGKLSDSIKKQEREIVFVVNRKDYPKEFSVLKKTKIYRFTNDSLNENKIYLEPLTNNYFLRCMTGEITFLAFTLGQYPVKLQEKYSFSYRKLKHNDVKTYNYDVEFTKRLWFWDLFFINKSLTSVISKEIRYQEQN